MRSKTTRYIALIFFLFSTKCHSALIGLSTDTDSVYEIDPVTGIATRLTNSGGNYAGVGLAFLDEDLYASDQLVHIGDPWDVRLSLVDLKTETSTSINQQDGSLNWHGLASNQSVKVLYSIDINDNFILKISDLSGQIISLGTGTGIDGRGLAYDDKNEVLYATDMTGGLYSVDTVTGAASLIGDLGLEGVNELSFIGLAYDELGEILFANIVPALFNQDGREGSLYIIDVTTGAATFIGFNGVNFIDGLAWVEELKDIPEPTAIALMGLGLAGIGFARKKKHA